MQEHAHRQVGPMAPSSGRSAVRDQQAHQPPTVNGHQAARLVDARAAQVPLESADVEIPFPWLPRQEGGLLVELTEQLSEAVDGLASDGPDDRSVAHLGHDLKDAGDLRAIHPPDGGRLLRTGAAGVWHDEGVGPRPVRGPPGTDLDRPVVAYLAATASGEMLPAEAAVAADVVRGGSGLVEDRGGRRFFARFTRSSDAMSAALEVGRCLGDRPLSERVCIAVDAGPVRPGCGGLDHDRVRRRAEAISAAGHGGQVLASDRVHSHLSASDAALVQRDLGLHRLEDLLRPERIWEVGRSNQPAFPALRSVSNRRTNLPSVLSPLIGRTQEVADLVELLPRERLVALVGSPGVGKSRLALAVAARSLDFDRTLWVDLSPTDSVAGAAGAVLRALGAPAENGVDPVEVVVDVLGQDRILLVLDDVGHDDAEVAALVTAVLERTHTATAMLTGQRPLAVGGEIVWQVPPLSTASRASIPDVLVDMWALRSEAAHLFCDRAARARPDMVFDEAAASLIATICSRLDGVALAIEVVAARCRHHSLESVATEVSAMEAGSWAAEGGPWGGNPLTDAIRRSYERLGRHDRDLLRSLSVFAGSFSAATAGGVLAAVTGRTVDPTEGLERLADASLIVPTLSDPPRYRLLAVIREFARRETVRRDEHELLGDAHAAWFQTWLEALLCQPQPPLGLIHAHIEDLLQAQRWCERDPPQGLRMLRSVATVARDLGYADDVLPSASRLLTRTNAELHPDVWLRAASQLALRYDMVADYGTFQDLVRELKSVAGHADDAYSGAVADFLLGDGEQVCKRLRALAQERGDNWVAALAGVTAAQTLAERDPRQADTDLCDTAWVGTADVGSAEDQVSSLARRVSGRVARDLGDFASAIEQARQMLNSRSTLVLENAVDLLVQVGLMTTDSSIVETALHTCRSRLRGPAAQQVEDRIVHVLGLLERTDASRVEPCLLGPRPLSVGSLRLLCQEAVDAGQEAVALGLFKPSDHDGPWRGAVGAEIRAMAMRDNKHAHAALRLAATHSYPLSMITALELIAAAASADRHLERAAVLLGAAESAREGTGYRWRFARDGAVATELHAAVEGGSLQAREARARGATMTLQAAAAYALRTWGPRRRPAYGWAALTPTEQAVAALVAAGRTNPQIAAQLLVRPSTVKTHLEHIFAKLDTHSRAGVATAWARRRPDGDVQA
jgi:predicted ATPase/DNA-binding CsgD family transcriptional regulator